MRRAFVVGGAITPFIGKGNKDFITSKHPDAGRRSNPTLEEYITRVVNDALTDAKCAPELVDRLVVGNFAGELFSKQGHLGAAAAGAHPALRHKPSLRVEGACASGALAISVCLDAIRGGADIALAIGAEVQSTVSPREGGDFLARASHYRRQRVIDDFTFPALFARRIKALVEAGSIKHEQLNALTKKAYSQGNLNPKAHMKDVKATDEYIQSSPFFLSNEELKPYLRVSDCSQVTDGGCAIVMASEEGMKKLNLAMSQAVEVKSLVVAADNLYEDYDPTRLLNCDYAVQKAYELAGIKTHDVQVAEVHDCFNVAELLMYESMGLAPRGKGINVILDGVTRLDGKCPVNTGGGLLSFGHPVGATGVKQVFEVYRQMKSKCEGYQMKTIPTTGLCLNMGGDDKTAVATVLQNC